MSRPTRDHSSPVPCWFCRENGREPAITGQQCKKCFACCCADCLDSKGLCPECVKFYASDRQVPMFGALDDGGLDA